MFGEQMFVTGNLVTLPKKDGHYTLIWEKNLSEIFSGTKMSVRWLGI